MITLISDVKQYLGLEQTFEYDDVLNSMIKTADNQLQNYLGGNVLNTEIEYNFRPQYYTDTKTLPFQKVNAIDELSYRTSLNGTWSVIDSTVYVLTDKPYQINYQNFNPNVYYKATLDVGFLDSEIPEMIRQAGTEMTVQMFKESDVVKGDLTGRLGIKIISSNSQVGGTKQYTFESVWEKWKNDLMKFKIIATGLK
jgi:hypothetical protein